MHPSQGHKHCCNIEKDAPKGDSWAALTVPWSSWLAGLMQAPATSVRKAASPQAASFKDGESEGGIQALLTKSSIVI